MFKLSNDEFKWKSEFWTQFQKANLFEKFTPDNDLFLAVQGFYFVEMVAVAFQKQRQLQKSFSNAGSLSLCPILFSTKCH